MLTYEYDIETYQELLLFCFQNHYDENDVIIFEVSKNKNELQDLVDFILSSKKRIITFNGIHFDSLITNYIVSNIHVLKILPALDIISHIYNVAQSVINEELTYNKYKYHNLYEEIDLFLLVSKGLRISKKLSLKFYAYNLDMDIMEMPVPHNKIGLTDEDIELVKKYVKQDVNVTKALALKKKEEINLRIWIRKEYKLNCLSWDAPKIASELLLDSYCDLTKGKRDLYEYKQEIRNRRYEKPSNIKLKDFIPNISFKTKQFQELYNEVLNSVNGFNKELIVKNYDGSYIKLQYGSGGIHSFNQNEKYITTLNKKIIDVDIQSMYPNLIKNLKAFNSFFGDNLLDIYIDVIRQRVEAKKAKQTVKDTFFKLILNSTSGILDNQYSWIFSPEQILALRVTGQLYISRLIEECILNNIKVLSVNTDGVTLEVENEPLLKQIINDLEQEINLIFEYTYYNFINYKSVNDYIALTDTSKIKVKGEYIYEKQLEGSNEFLIIPIAIKEYYVNKIPIEQTIKNHTNIYDFCMGKKISKDYEVYYQGNKIQQLNRIYVSKKGAYLYKRKKNKTTFENVLKDTPVCIYNTPDNNTPQSLNVDFDWYIKKTKEKLIELDNNNQLTLF